MLGLVLSSEGSPCPCWMPLGDWKFLSHVWLFATPWTHQKPIRLLCPWNSSSKNTGVGCHFLLQGISVTQDQAPVSCIGRWILYHLSHQGSPTIATANRLKFFWPRHMACGTSLTRQIINKKNSVLNDIWNQIEFIAIYKHSIQKQQNMHPFQVLWDILQDRSFVRSQSKF